MDALTAKAISVIKRNFNDIEADNIIDVNRAEDGLITFLGKDFKLLSINTITRITVENLTKSLSDLNSVILITKHTSTDVARALNSNNINFISADNRFSIGHNGICISANIHTKETNEYQAYEESYLLDNELKNLMTEATLKVILCLLSVKNAVAWSMRDIAQTAGVSLGSVQRTMGVLSDLSFIFKTPDGRFLKNKQQLLEVWVRGYTMILAPKVLMGKSMYRNSSAINADGFRLPALPEGCVWGGESGAFLIDHYLHPEQFSIFTDLNFRETCIGSGLIPHPNGNVSILRKFWTDSLSVSETTAPMLVIYAQLLATNDSRCVEAAQRLIQHENFSD